MHAGRYRILVLTPVVTAAVTSLPPKRRRAAALIRM